MHIALENGDTIQGEGVGSGMAKTELVFSTAYTGYEESITDPSYNGQGLIFAYPLIGNYGVDKRRFESEQVQPDVVIAREFTDGVRDWLRQSDTIGVESVDTRQLVLEIREGGSLRCGVASSERAAQRLCAEAVNQGIDMTYTPRDDLPKRYGNGGRPIIVMLDCGVKKSMIERFVERDAHVVRVPWDMNAEQIKQYDPDLLFVSNGPGDPEKYQKAIDTISYWHGTIPIAGICLGQQLITLALGGTTEKMKFGHRGSNQPVYDKQSENVRMTTQNHSFEVDEIPDELELVQYNINDKSPEGLESDNVICRQFHPEANPGPNDSLEFFDRVLQLCEE
jgi:carbamoyl-phosphate synthase small subunit